MSAVSHNMMNIWLVFGFLPVFGVFAASRFPPYIEVCKRETDMFPCLLKNTNICKEHLANGIPEFSIPPMNPLIIPKITIPVGEFVMDVENATFYGMDNFELLEMKFNLEDNFTVHSAIRLPFMDTTAAYTAKGKLLMIDLNGSGQGVGNITDVVATVDIKGKKVMRKGLEYVDIEGGKVSLKFNGPVYIYFNNLFGSREDLTVATNQIIQDNIMDFVNELSPFLSDVIMAIMLGIIKPMFRKFPLDELFPK